MKLTDRDVLYAMLISGIFFFSVQETTAWKILTDHGSPLKPFIKKFPSRAMNAVQNVFETLRVSSK
jgi:hypothetical protein